MKNDTQDQNAYQQHILCIIKTSEIRHKNMNKAIFKNWRENILIEFVSKMMTKNDESKSSFSPWLY